MDAVRLMDVKNIPYKEVKRHGKPILPVVEREDGKYIAGYIDMFNLLAFLEGRDEDFMGDEDFICE